MASRPSKKLTQKELELRILDAATRKAAVGSRTRVKAGVSVRSRTFSQASSRLLNRIADEIIAEAKIIARSELIGRTGDGFFDSADPRVAQHKRYMSSFQKKIFDTTSRPTIQISNTAYKKFTDGRTYRYGDMVEYGTNGPIFPKNGKYLAIKTNDSIAKSILGKRKSVKYGDGFLKYSDYGDMNGTYYYTPSVPGYEGHGIIARAVGNVLGRRAEREVERGR